MDATRDFENPAEAKPDWTWPTFVEPGILELELEYTDLGDAQSLQPFPQATQMQEVLLLEQELLDEPCSPALSFVRPGPCVKVLIGPRRATRPTRLVELSAEVLEPDLAGQLAQACRLADAVRNTEERSHDALYRAIECAYDFALSAASASNQLAALLDQVGIKAQDRAPMTPIVKLVFGAAYDKSRIAEYATVMAYAHRIGIGRRDLGNCLRGQPGGLKGIVQAERRYRRQFDPRVQRLEPRPSLTRRLRLMEPCTLAQLAGSGDEFGLVMVRRQPDGSIAIIGNVPRNLSLLERAAVSLIADRS